MEWNDDDLTCFTFCQISLSISLRHRREPRRRKGGKKDFFREEFRDLRTGRDSYLPPFLSLSLFSDPFFSLRSFTAFCKKKKGFSPPSSDLYVPAASKKDSPYLRSDRYIIRTARQGIFFNAIAITSSTRRHVHDETRLHTYTHTYTHTHTHQRSGKRREGYVNHMSNLVVSLISYVYVYVYV